MNIRDLTYIRAVARFKHFGRAAEHCHVSQPTLSGQIKKLETELGVTLFERDNRSVRITDVGKDIVALADNALDVIGNIRTLAETARDPLGGQFRLGFIPTIAPYLVPHFVRQSRQALPELRLNFMEDITDRLIEALHDGDLDAAILATPPHDPRLSAVALYDEPFWVIYPDAHKLRMIDAIHTSDLPADELLLLTEGHCFRDQALDVCKISAASEARAIQATSLATLVNMVVAGQGITLVPAMALAGQTAIGGVLTQKLSDRGASRRVFLTYRKNFPRQKLLDMIGGVICANLPEGVQPLG